MQKLEDVIKEQYGTPMQADKATGVSYVQIGRWISYKCLVDDKGQVWKPQGTFKHIAQLESDNKALIIEGDELDKRWLARDERIAELEKERDELLIRVTNCEKIFSDAPDLEFSGVKGLFPDEFEAHNLEQQAKGVSSMQILLRGSDWEDDELQLTLASRSIELNIKAKVLKDDN